MRDAFDAVEFPFNARVGENSLPNLKACFASKRHLEFHPSANPR